eukprot:GILK01012507.1.p1 GENE.GILK01012507.1~~GILK01012507.1.p1  ORF type:complete len:138 (-),score=22.90 GILK01012507.1:437-850(-)
MSVLEKALKDNADFMVWNNQRIQFWEASLQDIREEADQAEDPEEKQDLEFELEEVHEKLEKLYRAQEKRRNFRTQMLESIELERRSPQREPDPFEPEIMAVIKWVKHTFLRLVGPSSGHKIVPTVSACMDVHRPHWQ